MGETTANIADDIFQSSTENYTNVTVNETFERAFAFYVVIYVCTFTLIPVMIIANFVAILAIMKEVRRGNSGHLFLLSLCISDFLIGIFVAPLYAIYLIRGSWDFGLVFCHVFNISDWILVVANQLTIFLITLDRYLLTTRPHSYRNWRTRQKIYMMIGVAWLIPSFVFTPMVLVWKPERYVRKEHLCEIAIVTDPDAIALIVLFQYWPTTLLTIFLYYRIYRASTKGFRTPSQVRLEKTPTSNTGSNQNTNYDISVDGAHERNGNTHEANTGSNQNANYDISVGNAHEATYGEKYNNLTNNNDKSKVVRTSSTNHICNIMATSSGSPIDQQTLSNTIKLSKSNFVASNTLQTTPSSESLSYKRKAFRTITLLLGAYILFGSPVAVVWILGPFCDGPCVPLVFYDIFYGLYYVNSALNPFLYAKANRTLWKSMVKIFLCGRRQKAG